MKPDMRQVDIRTTLPSGPSVLTPPRTQDVSTARFTVAEGNVDHARDTLGKSTSRLPALDFTKGALVLIMVLYHWLNYFVTASPLVYKYLRFLTPSFIFIAGFLISHVYLSKYTVSGLRISRRLLSRGIKLLAIVISLNLPLSIGHIKLFSARAYDPLHGSGIEAYIIGTASVAFSVLVPIAYLLILSAGLLTPSKYYRNVYHLTCAGSVICAVMFEVTGINGGYLQIFSIGTLGISMGYVSIDQINDFVKHRFMLMSAYLIYLLAITIWDDIYILQVIGVFLSLSIIYGLGIMKEDSGQCHRLLLILLGQYSLFAYIIQIVFLQILRRSMRPLGAGLLISFTALIACTCCTIMGVGALHHTRARIRGVNRLYLAVFS